MSREQMKARLEAARPGPWEEYWQGHIHAPANYPQAAAVSICQTFGREDRVHPNAALIAHAPTDLAKLHAALDAVEAHCERIVSNADGHKPPGPPHPTPQQGVAVRILAIIRDALGEDA